MHFNLILATSAILALANASSLSGQATYYGGNVAGGACSFSTYTLPAGIFGTALSDLNWDTSANCGACVSVTGPSGNSLTAMIVDECPGCGTNHLDLFPDVFAALANPTTGVIDVTWDYVDCPITSALELHNKEGVSAYWFSMQVVNANKAVSTLEVSTDGGNTWQSTTRQTYNFFEKSSGFGTTTVDIKVTSESGDAVIVNNVVVSSGASTTASSNFGSAGSKSVAASSPAAAVVASSSLAPVAVSTPDIKSTTASSSAAVTSTAGGIFQVVSSSSEGTTSHTTISSTTTLYKTITVPKSTSTSTVSTTSYSSATYSPSLVTSSWAAANSSTALPSGYSLSTLAISVCKPTVLYSVIPIPSSSSIARPSTVSTGVVSYSANTTMPAKTSTPTVFTGSASGIRGSFFLAGLAGLITFLM